MRDRFAPPIPPRVARPPLSRTIIAGQTSVFNALGVGGLPLGYYWLRDGGPMPEQTRASLILSNAFLGDGGNYQLVVTNDFGAVTSAVAVVTVEPARPLLNPEQMDVPGASLRFSTVSGAVYIVQFKTNLSDSAWFELCRQNGAGAPIIVDDTNSPVANRFYRVQVE